MIKLKNLTIHTFIAVLIIFILPAGLSANFYIEGYIFDKHTLSPVSEATISVVESDAYTTKTDTKGYFILENIDKAVITLLIEKADYYPRVVGKIDLINSNNTQIRVDLSPTFIELQDITVSAKRTAISPNRTVVDVKKLNKASGVFDDPTRVLQVLPSVSVVNDQANHFSVRGNSPNATKWYLEDLEIINPNHLSNGGIDSDLVSTSGGGVLLLSGQVLDNTTFFNSAFPATYANGIGGIVNLSLNQGSEQKYNHRLKIGLLGIDVGSKGPINKGSRKSNYLANYRYSTVGLLSALGLDLGDEVINFQDFVFSVEQSISPDLDIKAYGFWGRSSNIFEHDSIADATTEQKFLSDIAFNSQSINIGTQLNYKPSDNSLFYAKINYGNQQNSRIQTLKQDNTRFADELDLQKLSTRIGWHSKFNKGVFKSSLAFTNNINEIENSGFSVPTNYSYIGFSNNVELQLNAKISTNAGLNLIYYDMYNEFLVEPRLSLTAQINDKLSTTLKYGKHSQYPYFRIATLSANENIRTEKAHHYNWSVQYNLNRVQLLGGLYYQQIFDVAIDTVSNGFFSAVNQLSNDIDFFVQSTGKARNYGFEGQAIYYGDKNFEVNLAASLSESMFNTFDGRWFDSRFNQNYSLTATISKDFLFSKNRVLGINTKITYADGFRFTPIDVSASLDSDDIVFRTDQIFAQQYPDFFRTDLKIYFQKKKKNRNSEWSLDIQNLTNRTNLAFISLDRNQQKLVEQNQLGLIPILSYKIDF